MLARPYFKSTIALHMGLICHVVDLSVGYHLFSVWLIRYGADPRLDLEKHQGRQTSKMLYCLFDLFLLLDSIHGFARLVADDLSPGSDCNDRGRAFII